MLEDLADAIKFPVLEFSKSTVTTVDTLAELTRETRLGLKKRLLHGVRIVDYAGNLFRIRKAEPVQMLLPKLTMGEILGYIEGNPRYRVRLVFDGKPTPVSLEHVKQMIRESFETDPWWHGVLDFEYFREGVENANTIPEVIDTFKEYHQ